MLCGSSAADKIPELVERLVDAGHNVKLVPTNSSETFLEILVWNVFSPKLNQVISTR